eukprot:GHVQ01012663.1.p1 GENE.GHVQ01012663.1~~GHVQ01012663.1.p1  ORF type:complete len:676 (+),score=115.33 GHVQ01012663.1:66-2093(+)
MMSMLQRVLTTTASESDPSPVGRSSPSRKHCLQPQKDPALHLPTLNPSSPHFCIPPFKSPSSSPPSLILPPNTTVKYSAPVSSRAHYFCPYVSCNVPSLPSPTAVTTTSSHYVDASANPPGTISSALAVSCYGSPSPAQKVYGCYIPRPVSQPSIPAPPTHPIIPSSCGATCWLPLSLHLLVPNTHPVYPPFLPPSHFSPLVLYRPPPPELLPEELLPRTTVTPACVVTSYYETPAELLQRVLGTGAYGQVVKVRRCSTTRQNSTKVAGASVSRELLALKVLNKQHYSSRCLLPQLYNELKCHSLCSSHDNIVHIHRGLQTDSHVFLLMELMDAGPINALHPSLYIHLLTASFLHAVQNSPQLQQSLAYQPLLQQARPVSTTSTTSSTPPPSNTPRPSSFSGNLPGGRPPAVPFSCRPPKCSAEPPIPVTGRSQYDSPSFNYSVYSQLQEVLCFPLSPTAAVPPSSVVLGWMPEVIAKIVVLQMLKGLEFLHCRASSILHRDIKPDNVLVNRRGVVKLSDFGWCSPQGESEGLAGTFNYMPPEMLLQHHQQRGQCGKVDVWAVGVCLYEFLAGQPLFPPLPQDNNVALAKMAEVMTERYILEKVTQLQLGARPVVVECAGFALWGMVTADAVDFLKSTLEIDVRKRLTSQQALEHRWLSSQRVAFERILEIAALG